MSIPKSTMNICLLELLSITETVKKDSIIHLSKIKVLLKAANGM